MGAGKEHFAGDSQAFWKKPCKEGAGNRRKGGNTPLQAISLVGWPLSLLH